MRDRDRVHLFAVSLLVLFLELAAIRWFPAHVLFLTFFTNTVLLACFLGMSIGCLAADRPRHYIAWTPALLAIALGAARGIEWWRERSGAAFGVGNIASPQLVFFGTESRAGDPSQFVLPIEVVAGALFVLVALAMLGPGQQLGRALARVPSRIEAYTVNITGSLVGVLLFMLCSRLQLGPVWWFGLVAAGLVYLLVQDTPRRALATIVGPGAVLLVAGLPSTASGDAVQFWSPYYRIDYNAPDRAITVNLIGHQQMLTRRNPAPAYALPHLLNRDVGRSPFGHVLVIGAGSGNDVSRALEWGADHVDAVEIDPVIYQLGRLNHPDLPYRDRRVSVHLNDGRNYLKSTNKQYDLIIYALVDSLVLHSSYSNIRLESYLFTQEAFRDVRARLRPGGLFVMYNFFRQGWIVSRLESMLESTFGARNPIVFNLPPRERLQPDDTMLSDFTMFVAGDTGALKEAFARRPRYRLPPDRPLDAGTPNGFEAAATAGALEFWPSTVGAPSSPLGFATDAWPFLYLRSPMIPALSLRGIAIMGGIGLAFLVPFVRPRAGASRGGWQMLWLGAGFMLIETKAVVQMALLFGGTWVVNSIVLCAVLLMILGANLFVLIARPRSLAPFYTGLFLSLAANIVTPMDLFLGLAPAPQIAASCLLVFTPIFFAGVIFAVSFRAVEDAGRAFGFNIAGALVGGLAENSSMLLGFQYVAVVAMVFYAASWLSLRRHSS
jgi:SAM-dependent methyltransferase